MRRLASALSLLFLMTISAAAQEPKQHLSLPSVKLPPELDRVLRDYERAWQASDEEQLASFFTEDGFVLSQGSPPVRGRAKIRERYSDSGGGPLFLRALDYAKQGSVGYIIGAYGGEPGVDDGKFVLALRRVGRKWLIAADIDNSNRRSRPPAQ